MDGGYMKKSFILVLILMFSFILISCNKKIEVNEDKSFNLSEGLIDKLIYSINEEMICYDMAPYFTKDKIDKLTSNSTLYNIQFIGDNFYYACGYRDDSYDYEVYPSTLTWRGFNNEKDITNKYENMELKVAFKIDITTNVIDVIKNEKEEVKVEYIKKIKLEFDENGKCLYKPDIFVKEYLYITANTNHFYMIYNDNFLMNKTFNFTRLLDGLYLKFRMYSSDEVLKEDFGSYYDELISLMKKESVEDNKYGLISIDDFKAFIILHLNN